MVAGFAFFSSLHLAHEHEHGLMDGLSFTDTPIDSHSGGGGGGGIKFIWSEIIF